MNMEMNLVYLVQTGDTIKIAVLWFHTVLWIVNLKIAALTLNYTQRHTQHIAHTIQ